jgi:glutathione S-transferase
MLELYHHGSSACAAKVRFALGEKGLGWVGHYVDILKGEQFRPEFPLAINPKAVVPVAGMADILRWSRPHLTERSGALHESPFMAKRQ